VHQSSHDGHPDAGEPPSLRERLSRVIESRYGAGARLASFAPMEDGHAGLTFGFDVVSRGGEPVGSYVLKVAPPGVTRRGNTDVYRQAPLLRALHGLGLPVPDVPWASPDEDLLGTPFIVMERMPGRIFFVWEPHGSFLSDPTQLEELWLQAARLLARLHLVDWKAVLADWEAPRPLSEELARWAPVLRHAQDPAWLSAGTRLHDTLASAVPDGLPIGIVHGDFQPGNILYEKGRVKGLIDWELSSIGAQGADVGWLLMMADTEAWDPAFWPVAPVSCNGLRNAYEAAGGPALTNLNWYQALAHYRLGSIACLNVKLHRTGKRVDPLWERFAPSIAPLFARGIVLAEQAVSQSSAPRPKE